MFCVLFVVCCLFVVRVCLLLSVNGWLLVVCRALRVAFLLFSFFVCVACGLPCVGCSLLFCDCSFVVVLCCVCLVVCCVLYRACYLLVVLVGLSCSSVRIDCRCDWCVLFVCCWLVCVVCCLCFFVVVRCSLCAVC